MALTNVKVRLIGKSGNAFYILGKVSEALEKAGHKDLAQDYLKKASTGDYHHLLATTMQYVEVE